MTNIIDILKPIIIDAAKTDWRIAAGLAGVAALAGIGKWIWNRRHPANDADSQESK